MQKSGSLCLSNPENSENNTHKNMFSRKNKEICSVEEAASIEESFNVNSISTCVEMPHMQITVNKTRVECIDSGSSVNIMNANTYQSLKDKPALTSNKTKSFTYSSKEELPILGCFLASITYKETSELAYYDMRKNIHLYVDAGPLGLGAILAQEKDGVSETITYDRRSLTATEKSNLQKREIDFAHRGHSGIVKTKQLLRSKVWFPNLDKIIEDVVRKCHACQVATPQHTRDPIVNTELPKAPWENLDIDFTGPYPGGHLRSRVSKRLRHYYLLLHILTSVTSER
ncbi:RNase H-like domain found in reverse transcriptase [Popillia japonica]|uniref:RNA-directed DNA polymerase n=1 Tax=Popillia japonica TaxID=7064 RepID=A0AAW1IVS3_POPJA